MDATRLLRLNGFENLIVAVTGNVLDDDVDTFLRAGADIVFSKPLRLEQLDRLREHMEANGPLSLPGMKLEMIRDKLIRVEKQL